MGARYYVHVLEGQVAIDTKGPYGLTSAKDYARIGSQHGLPRAVTRGQSGLPVRVYSEGKRFWPLAEHVADGALKGMTKEEIPIELGRSRPDPKLGAAVRTAFWREGQSLAVDIDGDGPGDRFRQYMLNQHGVELRYDLPIFMFPDIQGEGAIFVATNFGFTEDQGIRLMAGEWIVKNVPVAQLESMVIEFAVTRH